MSSRTVFTASKTPEATNFGFSSISQRDGALFVSPSNLSVDTLVDDSGTRTASTFFVKQRSSLISVIHRSADFLANNAGLLLVASSQAFFAMMNVAVKKLNTLDPPVPAFELVLVRMFITSICSIAYMVVMKIPDPVLGPKGVRWLLACRGFSGFFGLFGLYYSLQFLSLSDATVLTFLTPFMTAIAGALLLKESFSKKEALAGCCSILGVVFIARPAVIFGNSAYPEVEDGKDPTSDEVITAQRLVAVGVALLGVVGSTGAYISIRSIGNRAHPLHTLTSFAIQCVVVASVLMIIMNVPVVLPSTIEWFFLFIMIGIFGFIAQLLMAMGLQRETAGRATMAIYIQIIFATIMEKIFFQTTPPFLSIAGTVIIMSSAIYVALTKEKDQKQTAIPLDHSGDAAMEEGLLASAEHEEDTETAYKLMDIKASSSSTECDDLSDPAKSI